MRNDLKGEGEGGRCEKEGPGCVGEGGGGSCCRSVCGEDMREEGERGLPVCSPDSWDWVGHLGEAVGGEEMQEVPRRGGRGGRKLRRAGVEAAGDHRGEGGKGAARRVPLCAWGARARGCLEPEVCAGRRGGARQGRACECERARRACQSDPYRCPRRAAEWGSHPRASLPAARLCPRSLPSPLHTRTVAARGEDRTGKKRGGWGVERGEIERRIKREKGNLKRKRDGKTKKDPRIKPETISYCCRYNSHTVNTQQSCLVISKAEGHFHSQKRTIY